MSKKKKKNKPYRSVLDESLTKDKPAAGTDEDITKPAGQDEPEPTLSVSEAAFLPEMNRMGPGSLSLHSSEMMRSRRMSQTYWNIVTV